METLDLGAVPCPSTSLNDLMQQDVVRKVEQGGTDCQSLIFFTEADAASCA